MGRVELAKVDIYGDEQKECMCAMYNRFVMGKSLFDFMCTRSIFSYRPIGLILKLHNYFDEHMGIYIFEPGTKAEDILNGTAKSSIGRIEYDKDKITIVDFDFQIADYHDIETHREMDRVWKLTFIMPKYKTNSLYIHGVQYPIEQFFKGHVWQYEYPFADKMDKLKQIVFS